MKPSLLLQYGVPVGTLLVGLVLPRLAKAVPAGQLADTIARAWRFVLSNPRSSIAGVAALLASFSPKYAGQITGIATGIGFLLTSDAAGSPKPPDGHA